MKRFVALADEVTASIRAGTLRPGDRLPSVRRTSENHQISAATVFQAYYLLEARGLVRARDRSGYFVTGTTVHRPQLLQRASRPKTSAIAVDVAEYVFQILEATMRRDIVPLGSAFPSPSLFPLRRIAKTMAATVQRLDPRASVEYLMQGNAELRRQIALRYAAEGLELTADDIVITNGAMEALNLCLSCVTRPGDAVVLESPTFYAALQALQRHGLRAIEAPTHPSEGIELDALAKILERQRPRACWLMTNFQNPLGSLMSDDKKRDLVVLLSRYETALIEDDVYAQLYFGRRRPTPAKAFDESGWVMHCSSFSKCLAPGYRIGWVAPGRFVQQVARLKLSTSLTASVPAETTLTNYLQHGGYDRHLRQLRRRLATQRDTMIDALKRYFPADVRITRPQGGYFLWVECASDVDALDIHRRALALNISVAPGPIFSSRGQFGNCLRLNYGHPWTAELERALENLGRLIGGK